MEFEGRLVPRDGDENWLKFPCCGFEYHLTELKSAPYGILKWYCPNCEREEYENNTD